MALVIAWPTNSTCHPLKYFVLFVIKPSIRLAAFQPFTFDGGAYVEFQVTEKHRRKQLIATTSSISRRIRSIGASRSHSLSLQFRSSLPEGLLLLLATNDDYTAIYVSLLETSTAFSVFILPGLIGAYSYGHVCRSKTVSFIIDPDWVNSHL